MITDSTGSARFGLRENVISFLHAYRFYSKDGGSRFPRNIGNKLKETTVT
jgi:hypothetical protein